MMNHKVYKHYKYRNWVPGPLARTQKRRFKDYINYVEAQLEKAKLEICYMNVHISNLESSNNKLRRDYTQLHCEHENLASKYNDFLEYGDIVWPQGLRRSARLQNLDPQ